jgi:hypothetical protein
MADPPDAGPILDALASAAADDPQAVRLRALLARAPAPDPLRSGNHALVLAIRAGAYDHGAARQDLAALLARAIAAATR